MFRRGVLRVEALVDAGKGGTTRGCLFWGLYYLTFCYREGGFKAVDTERREDRYWLCRGQE